MHRIYRRRSFANGMRNYHHYWTPFLRWYGLTDPECRIMTGNYYVSKMFGLPSDTNLSQTLAKKGQAPKILHLKLDGTELQPEEMPMQLSIATRKPVLNMEFTSVLPDGSRINAIGNAVPLFDENGQVRGSVCAVLDITETKQTSAKLQRQTQGFLMTAVGFVVILGGMLIVLMRLWQTAKKDKETLRKSKVKLTERVKELTGIYSLGVLTEKHENLHDIYNEFVNKIVPISMQFPDNVCVLLEVDNVKYSNIENCNLSKYKEYLSAEINVFKKQIGRLVVCYTYSLPFIEIHEQKLIDAYAERISKITERKKSEHELKNSEQSLKKANATKDKFFSIIAHDLRSPFNAILGFSNILVENHREYDDEKRDEMIKLVNISANKTFKLLENLLTWSRSQLGGIEYLPEKSHLKILLFETLSDLQGQADKKNIQIVEAVSENELIYVDKNMIAVVLRNLISNAIKYTHPNGVIKINTEQNENNITISITDTGVGIDNKKFVENI